MDCPEVSRCWRRWGAVRGSRQTIVAWLVRCEGRLLSFARPSISSSHRRQVSSRARESPASQPQRATDVPLRANGT